MFARIGDVLRDLHQEVQGIEHLEVAGGTRESSSSPGSGNRPIALTRQAHFELLSCFAYLLSMELRGCAFENGNSIVAFGADVQVIAVRTYSKISGLRQQRPCPIGVMVKRLQVRQ